MYWFYCRFQANSDLADYTFLPFQVARARKESEAPGLQSINESKSASSPSRTTDANSRWTFEMNQLLIKAVNLFPAGTQKRWAFHSLPSLLHLLFISAYFPFRWEVIAAYVNQHEKGVEVTGKEALKQAKNIRQDCKSRALPSFVATVPWKMPAWMWLSVWTMRADLGTTEVVIGPGGD